MSCEPFLLTPVLVETLGTFKDSIYQLLESLHHLFNTRAQLASLIPVQHLIMVTGFENLTR